MIRNLGFALAAFLLPAAAMAADAPASYVAMPSGPQGATWAEIAKLPDWSGAWQLDQHADPRQSGAAIPFTPVYDAELKRLRAIGNTAGDSPGNAKLCIPIGPIFQTPLMLSEFLYQPGLVEMISEKRDIQRIYTDGRPHNKVPAGFYGDTIGHWEGDTLYTDTVNLRPDGELFYAMKTGAAGKDIHIIERFHEDEPGHIRIDVTMVSPTAFTAPMHENIQFTKVKFPIGENVCEQNNHDVDPFGHQQFAPRPTTTQK
jgi:hypothetical protein